MKLKCRECDQGFVANKPWQEFCCAQCRDGWHNRQRKNDKYAAAVEAAERRINGRSRGEEKIDLAALGLGPKPLKRRRIIGAEA